MGINASHTCDYNTENLMVSTIQFDHEGRLFKNENVLQKQMERMPLPSPKMDNVDEDCIKRAHMVLKHYAAMRPQSDGKRGRTAEELDAEEEFAAIMVDAELTAVPNDQHCTRLYMVCAGTHVDVFIVEPIDHQRTLLDIYRMAVANLPGLQRSYQHKHKARSNASDSPRRY